MRVACASVAGLALWGLVGCREERPSTVWLPPLLTGADVERYTRAEEDLGVGGKSLDELHSFLGVEQREVTAALAGVGFTPTQFLELAETMFLARHGRQMFVDLPRERAKLAAALAEKEWSGPQAAAIKQALLKEAQSGAERSQFVERVLQNAAVVEAYEARTRAAKK